jgi:O-antigen/teichoic acid export membrane protein
MTLVGRNVVANFAGRLWATLLSLAVVPVYLSLLGVETYGLVGIYASLTAIFALLDLGLGNLLNRRLAQAAGTAEGAVEAADFTRTLEIVYWVVGLVIGVVTVIAAPLIAWHWVRPEGLSPATVEETLKLMGLAIAVQWPRALYSGGLMGQQRQVLLNMISSASATLLNVGGALVVWFVSPTIQALVAWTILVGFADTLTTRHLLWRGLRVDGHRPSFNATLLVREWRFAAGMTGISVMAVVLTQLDKIILSRVLTLEEFGYYTLAWRVASCLYPLVSPVASAYFPRLSQLASGGDQVALSRLYHQGCQYVSAIVFPVAAVLGFFATPLLEIWTHSSVIAERAGPTLALLAAGTALNAAMNLPLTLQLAHGWTRLVFQTNTAAVVALGPLIYWMSLHYGGFGAALVWLLLNLGYLVVLMLLMHRRLLKGELLDWYVTDVGIPLVACAGTAAVWRWVTWDGTSHAGGLLTILAAAAMTLAAGIVATPGTREVVTRIVRPSTA